MIEPSGISYGYFGAAVGKGRQAAKTELEKLKLREFTCREAVNDVARMYVKNFSFSPCPANFFLQILVFI